MYFICICCFSSISILFQVPALPRASLGNYIIKCSTKKSKQFINFWISNNFKDDKIMYIWDMFFFLIWFKLFVSVCYNFYFWQIEIKHDSVIWLKSNDLFNECKVLGGSGWTEKKNTHICDSMKSQRPVSLCLSGSLSLIMYPLLSRKGLFFLFYTYVAQSPRPHSKELMGLICYLI